MRDPGGNSSGDNYWTRSSFSRRSALRYAGIGIGGLAGAALVGCGGDDDDGSSGGADGSGSPGAGGGGNVPAGEVRIPAGLYEGSIEPTGAEADPLANGRYGGTLKALYLDPPHMDFNRVLSCTINTTHDYTKNKLTRAVLGARANILTVDIEPDLAESWQVNDDATEFVFTLRQGVKFHNIDPVNGREFTSDDVRASIERYQAGGVQKDVFAEVTGLETPDDYTVVVRLGQPLSDFPRNIAAWSHMDARELADNDDLMAEKAIGTGPFIQEEWTPKERSVFARHAEYFEEGLPFLDRIETYVRSDAAALRAGFQTDNWYYWRARDDAEVEAMSGSVEETGVMLRYPWIQGVNTSGMHFQMSNPKWQDERVRRAFSLGIDRVDWDLANLTEGGGYSKSPIAWSFLYDEVPTMESQGEWYQYDIQKARQLLQAAGYSEDSPIEADAPVWYFRNEYQEILSPMYQEIPELRFNIRVVDNPTAVQMLNDRNYEDTMNVTWGPPAYSVDQMVYPWYLSTGGLNHNNVNSPEMDSLLHAQRAEQDPEAQREIFLQIEQMIFDQVWDVFFPAQMYVREFWHNYVMNYRPHGISRSGLTCYLSGQARAMWLDEGAPNTAWFDAGPLEVNA
ncbi:MAG: hypothetical protein GEU80_04435 [Dehalococcoidia bacterium]|nr:hypothetical protein [Dehalococcoidia bacterium]